MELYERLKYLRKEVLNITQDEFSKKLNITRGNLASIEVGRIAFTSRNIKAVCTAYNINELWLLEGIEPIFRQQSIQEEIASYIGDILSADDNAFQKRFILALSKLDNDGWDVLEKLIDNISKVK